MLRASTFFMVLLFVLVVAVAHVFACKRKITGGCPGDEASVDITQYVIAV